MIQDLGDLVLVEEFMHLDDSVTLMSEEKMFWRVVYFTYFGAADIVPCIE
jgi:hypothetical protein